MDTGYLAFNGLLGKYHTNQLSIEIQLMRQFLNDMDVRCLSVSAMALNVKEQALFGQLLGSSAGGAATETLFYQDCQLTEHLQTYLSISQKSVVPSLE